MAIRGKEGREGKGVELSWLTVVTRMSQIDTLRATGLVGWECVSMA